MEALPPVRPRVSSINVNEAWNSVFQDPSIVQKTVVGSVLGFVSLLFIPIPFVVPVLMGYGILTVRNAAAGEPYPLPEWQGFGQMWILGAKYWLAMMVYMSPLLLPMCGAFGLIVAGSAMGKGGEPFVFIGILGFYALIFFMQFIQIAFLLTIYPTVALKLAVEDSLAATFSVRRVWEAFRENPWNIMLSGVLKWATGMVAAFAIFLCVLPMFPIRFLGEAFAMACLGQAQRLAFEAYAVGPPDDSGSAATLLDPPAGQPL